MVDLNEASLEQVLETTSRIEEKTGCLLLDVTLSTALAADQVITIRMSDEAAHYHHVGHLATRANAIDACECLLFYVLAENKLPLEIEHLEYGKSPGVLKASRKRFMSSLRALDADLHATYEVLNQRAKAFSLERGKLVHGLLGFTPEGLRIANANATPKIRVAPTYVEFEILADKAEVLCDDLTLFLKDLRFAQLMHQARKDVVLPSMLMGIVECMVLSEFREVGIQLPSEQKDDDE